LQPFAVPWALYKLCAPNTAAIAGSTLKPGIVWRSLVVAKVSQCKLSVSFDVSRLRPRLLEKLTLCYWKYFWVLVVWWHCLFLPWR